MFEIFSIFSHYLEEKKGSVLTCAKPS